MLVISQLMCQVNQGLQSIFGKLKGRGLDQAIASDEHRHLYDFVDSVSVQRLQRQAVQEIREMEVINITKILTWDSNLTIH